MPSQKGSRHQVGASLKAATHNQHYTNCGTDENESVPVTRIVEAVEWNYYNRYNQLYAFYDNMVIKD